MKKFISILLSTIIIFAIPLASAQSSSQLQNLLHRKQTIYTKQTERLQAQFSTKCSEEPIVPPVRDLGSLEGSDRCQLIADRLTRLERIFNRSTKLLQARVSKLQQREESQKQIIRNDIFHFTNLEREKVGLPPFTYNLNLELAAEGHSQDMAKRDFFDHENPDGKMPEDRIMATGYLEQTENCNCGYSYATGENIAYVDRIDPTGKFYVELWMDSQGHRENIVREDFTEMGIGFFENYATQNFGRLTINQEFIEPQATLHYADTERRDYSNFESKEEYETYMFFALGHINSLREKEGKAQVLLNPLLTEIARRHSEDMAKNIKEMSHDGSQLETAHERIKEGKVPNTDEQKLERIPYPANIAWNGENVGKRNINASYKVKIHPDLQTSEKDKSIKEAILDQHLWFLDEPEDEANHRTTMLSTLYPFSEVGIGLYLDDNGNLWITEDYISVQE